MKIGIIDYGRAICIGSPFVAMCRAQAGYAGIYPCQRSITGCDYIIVPGVGHFADCWAGLSAIDGMVNALTDAVGLKAKPFLGICGYAAFGR